VTVNTVALFLALLAVVAELGAAAVAGAWLLHRARSGSTAWQQWIVAGFGPSAFPLAAVVAGVSMAGSLYFSEVANFVPCSLCWYQRIAMYSLAVLLGLAAVRRDSGIRPYAMVLAAIGLAISTYHVMVERFPNLESGVCSATAPCTVIWVKELGYLTIPTMAWSGFAAILALLATDGAHRAVDTGARDVSQEARS